MIARAPCTIAVEGPIDEAIARRLLAEVGLEAGAVSSGDGKSRIDGRIRAWNAAAKAGRWSVLRDLDHDAECAPSLVRRLLPEPDPRMCFRIAVREAEAWLLGDRERAARWLGVPITKLPRDPECEPAPKQKLVDLARFSTRREIRRDIVPLKGSTARVGRGYRASVEEFVRGSWRPGTAAARCASLAGCLDALRRLHEGS